METVLKSSMDRMRETVHKAWASIYSSIVRIANMDVCDGLVVTFAAS